MAAYRSDLAIEISGSVAIPQEVLDALADNGTLHIEPESNDVAFFGNHLSWEPMYDSLKVVMAFLETLSSDDFQYLRFGQDPEDVFFEGRFHSQTSSFGIFDDLAEAVFQRHIA